MKKLLAILCLLWSFHGAAQVKISDMPTFIGNPAGGWVPIVISGTNRKIDAGSFGFSKLDNITRKVGTDSLFTVINGVQTFVTLMDTIPGIPTLQAVVAAGHTSTNSFNTFSNTAVMGIQGNGNGGLLTLGWNGAHPQLEFTNSGLSTNGLQADRANGRIWQLPDSSGTVALLQNIPTVDTTTIPNFSVKVRSLFSGTAPILYTNGTISITQAATAANGYLSSTDWNTFNGKTNGLTPTAVKTANYSAAAGDLVPCDNTGGSFTVTLPTAPADKTTIAVKIVVLGASNTITVSAGGSDVFNKAAGSVTLSLTLLNQSVVLQYKSSSAIWYVISTDAPISTFQPLITTTTPITLNGASVGVVNQGTSSSVLHGNTSGNAAFGSVVNGDISGRIDSSHLFIQLFNLKYPLVASPTNDTGSVSQSWIDSAKLIINRAATANTVYDGVTITDSTMATNNNQMYSGYVHFRGYGWNVTSSASEPNDMRFGVQPIQNASLHPTPQLTFDYRVNDSTWINFLKMTSGGLTVFNNVAGSRSIQINSSTGSLDCIGGAFHLNRFQTNAVAVGFSAASHFRVGQAPDPGTFGAQALVYLGNTETALPVLILDAATSQSADVLDIRSNGSTSGADLLAFGPTGKLTLSHTNTTTGTTGAQTINKASGTVNIAASGTSVVVTNSLVTATSIVFAVLRTADATATIKNVVPAAGSFTITLGAAATAEVSIGFFVIN